QRAAAAGVGRRARQCLRARPRVLRQADSERQELARRQVICEGTRGLGDCPQSISPQVPLPSTHFGSGTGGTVYTFFNAAWYSPNSDLIPSNSFFTAAR